MGRTQRLILIKHQRFLDAIQLPDGVQSRIAGVGVNATGHDGFL